MAGQNLSVRRRRNQIQPRPSRPYRRHAGRPGACLFGRTHAPCRPHPSRRLRQSRQPLCCARLRSRKRHCASPGTRIKTRPHSPPPAHGSHPRFPRGRHHRHRRRRPHPPRPQRMAAHPRRPHQHSRQPRRPHLRCRAFAFPCQRIPVRHHARAPGHARRSMADHSAPA